MIDEEYELKIMRFKSNCVSRIDQIFTNGLPKKGLLQIKESEKKVQNTVGNTVLQSKSSYATVFFFTKRISFLGEII